MKKMINILLTVSMLTSCVSVPFAANAAEGTQAAIVQTSTEENFNISEKLKGDIEAGLEKIDVIIQCVIKYDVKSITAEIQNAVAEYAETLDTSVYSADEINQMIGEFKNEFGDQKYQEAYSVKYQEICDYIGIDVTEAEFVGTKLSCTLTPEQIYKIAYSEYIKGIVIEKSEFVSGEEVGYHQIEVTDNKVEEAEKAKELFSKYIEENKLDAKVVGQETYPDYFQPVIIEYNTSTVQNGLLIEFAEKNDIDRSIFTFVPIVNGIPMTTTNSNLNNNVTTTTEVVKLTDVEKIRELFNGYIEENNLDAKVTGQEKYPDYTQHVIIEYNTQTVQNGLLLEFAEQNNIDRTLFTFIPIVNGVPITTANPNGNTPTTTTTTTAVQEAQALFNKYFEENKMDARCVTSENYPSNYPPLVIEYATESVTITGPMIVEFAEKNNIDRTLFTVAPTVNGVPMIAQDVDTNVKGDTNCDGQVDMADAVLIMQALANPNKYGINGTADNCLTEQGKINGDVDGNGLTVGDAQAIQKKLLGLDKDDIDETAIIGKTYLYDENDNDCGFTITFNEDGKYAYYECSISSMVGLGTWKIKGNTIVLTDMPDSDRVNRFEIKENGIAFIENNSDNFSFCKLKDGDEFSDMMIKNKVDWYSDFDKELADIEWNSSKKEDFAVIKDNGELKAYLETKYREEVVSKYLAEYDENYFKDNVLLMNTIYQGSGSEARYMVHTTVNPDGSLGVFLINNQKDSGDAMISVCLAQITVSKSVFINEGQTVECGRIGYYESDSNKSIDNTAK